jgi:hydrogenase maturation protein HypF
MNRVLADGLAAALRARGLKPLMARKVPCNDGGLSLGQVAMASQGAMASAATRAGLN